MIICQSKTNLDMGPKTPLIDPRPLKKDLKSHASHGKMHLNLIFCKSCVLKLGSGVGVVKILLVLLFND